VIIVIVANQYQIGRRLAPNHSPWRNLNCGRTLDGKAAVPLPFNSLDQGFYPSLLAVANLPEPEGSVETFTATKS